jgi:hypothetical protein
MVCNDAKNVKISNLTLITRKTPVASFQNCSEVIVDGLYSNSAVSPLVQIGGASSGKTLLKNLSCSNQEKQVVLGKEVPKNVVQLEK